MNGGFLVWGLEFEVLKMEKPFKLILENVFDLMVRGTQTTAEETRIRKKVPSSSPNYQIIKSSNCL